MKITLILSTLFSLLLFLPQEQTKPRFLPPADFDNSYRLEVYAFIVDVRMKMEYKKKRLEHAINVPDKKSMSLFTDSLDLETPIFVYCTTDTRAIGAAEFLVEKEFVNVYILDGGIRQWIKEGFPVERKRKRKN